MKLFVTALTLSLGTLSIAGPASAARGPWATINFCDTVAHPNAVGVRAAMPAASAAGKLLMRFKIQYRQSDGSWQLIGKSGDSGFVKVGRTTTAQESGWTFQFEPPRGGSYVMRAIVIFRWDFRSRPDRGARRVTTVGHRGTTGADPSDFSAATCEIS